MAGFGDAVDIEKFKDTAKNRIHRIGIELEGGWTKVPRGTTIDRDGSVDLSCEGTLNPDIRLVAIGELPSPPLSFNEADDIHWVTWLHKFYPQVHNGTCGMHVHMSFNTALTYMRLMHPSYPATVIAGMTSWAKRVDLSKNHPIWSRLKGKSIYCQHVFDPEGQIKNNTKDHDQRRAGHRYTAINYCFSRTGTMECRLLPMMETPDRAQEIITELLRITNGYLLATKKKEPKHKVETGDEEGPLLEERHDRI